MVADNRAIRTLFTALAASCLFLPTTSSSLCPSGEYEPFSLGLALTGRVFRSTVVVFGCACFAVLSLSFFVSTFRLRRRTCHSNEPCEFSHQLQCSHDFSMGTCLCAIESARVCVCVVVKCACVQVYMAAGAGYLCVSLCVFIRSFLCLSGCSAV